ncbi:MAG: hypothetical protein IAE79_15720 [Anaerolinea sp.]|nr:hypothetical protein [Anaerolinea sp.]
MKRKAKKDQPTVPLVRLLPNIWYALFTDGTSRFMLLLQASYMVWVWMKGNGR